MLNRTRKRYVSCKITKRKPAKNSKPPQNVAIESRKKINEAFRIHKARGQAGDTWELVPKDSCEVYKARRRRQIESKRIQQRVRSPSENSNSDGDRSRRKVTRQLVKNAKKRKNDKKGRRKQPLAKALPRRRRSQGSRGSSARSNSSYTATSMSISSETDY